MEIKNNSFIGVKWDGKAIKSIEIVAEALLNLSRLFINQNIKIDSLISINTKNEENK